MPNPKKKHSQSRRDSRRASNWTIKAENSSKCPNCGAAKLPHRICKACGFYNGELIVPKKEKKKTAEQKKESEQTTEGKK
ncbi:MAG: 50S ribosomal protein L32 [Endomicrobiales bacterium]|nr:50S ribosomal protein L32 [Endomicrobiales bacterium]